MKCFLLKFNLDCTQLRFSLGLRMLTGMCHSWLSLSSFHLQPTYLVRRGNASLQSTGLSIYLPSGDLVKQEEPKKGKKGRWLFVLINRPLSLELSAVYPLFVN